jgi:uncharacterized protein (DUF1697 family)
MKTFISLLRGINVSGKNRIGMPDLKRLYESLGLVDLVTYIQSGNVVFDYAENEPAKIAKMIETGITKSFGCDVRVILRDKEGFNKILGSNPFLNQRKTDPEKLYVTFLSKAPMVSEIQKLPFPKDYDDEFMLYDKEIYLFCPNRYGKTKFSNTFFEKKLGVSATTRNWKTVNALFEIAERR